MSDKNLMNGKGEEDWITIKGTHVKVEEGQSEEETAENFIESHENKQNNEQKGKDGQTPKKEEKDENLPQLDKNKPPPDEEAEELKRIEDEKKRKRKEKFSKDIDEILKLTDIKKLRNGCIQMTEDTPKILQEIGLPNTPLYINTDHVYKCILDDGILKQRDDHYHGLGKELFMQIPELLEEPELVFKAPPSPNRKKDKESIVVIVNAVDKMGKPMMVAIELNSKIEGKGRVNRITSAYGRGNLKNYIEKNATEKTILYKKQEEKKEEVKEDEK